MTTTPPPPNSDGEASAASSPTPRPPAATSCRSSPTSGDSRAAVSNAVTERSTSSSSSPTTRFTGARGMGRGYRSGPTARAVPGRPGPRAPGQAAGSDVAGGQDGLAAAPDAVRLEAVGPGERALMVGVPLHDVGVAAAGHGAAVRSPQGVRTTDGGRAQGLGHAHPEVPHGQRDDQGHGG